MADPNHPQFGQTFPPQFRPPLPTQGVQNQPAGQGPAPQGQPKLANIPPLPVQGQFQGGPPNNMMNMGPQGQVPQGFPGGPLPPASGGVNGFVPPMPQGFVPQGPMGMNRPLGPPPSVGSGAPPSQPPSNFRPPVSGQHVPPSSCNSSLPPTGAGQTLNGTNTPPFGQPPSIFPPPQLTGKSPGPPQLAFTSAQAPSGQRGPPPRMAVPPAGGSGSAPFVSANSTSGTSTPTSGHLSPPSELPIPFHGQAQYSHQIGASMKLTPNPTPNNSEPPSRRSSRDPSPVNEQSYDALEGQFSPGQGTPSSMPSQGQTGASPLPGPAATGPHVPFLPAQGQGTAVPPPGQMTPTLFGPGAPVSGPPGNGAVPPMGGVMARPPGPQMYPSSMPSSQLGPSTRPPGPPTGLPGPPTGPHILPSGPPGPPLGPPGPLPGPPGPSSGPFGPSPAPPGPPSGLPGPSAGPRAAAPGFSGPPSGPPRPPSGPLGPPSGPFNLGPPTSTQGSASGSNYYQPPPTSQGMMGPPLGPPSSPAGPASGPTGPFPSPSAGPAGPYPQPHVGQGYPQPTAGYNAVNSMAGDFNRMGMNDTRQVINLMQEKKLIPPDGVETVRPSLYHDHKRVNCNPEVFRCTLNAIPQSSALLNKARLPLGILIHPFKDLSQLPVIQSSVIVRCRSCRTYINPFVTFVDQRRWKCNLCFRVNDLPDEFSFDPVSKTYGEPQRRPEIRSATIEFIAPSEYMLRPPQPAVYLFVLDVSFNAIETGYLRLFTQTLIEELDRLPGDARTQIGFLCFDRALYFFNLSEGLSQPQMMVVPDLEDVFLPCPDSLMVNLHECRDMVVELLNQLPALFEGNQETGSALGSALQASFKLMTGTGGRVTVMQTTLPTVGPGALENREGGSKPASLNASSLGPSSDFYKKLALDCSAQQIAVDLFMLSGQYADIATISCISKYSAGCVHYYPAFHTERNTPMSDKFEADLRRYITRKIGFEAVMRIRCTRGVSIHTFHGNFFVRSTDLLSLPNVNPDAGFGMQMSIEENLTESSTVCFQAALLYTSSKGERRIRVHSLCVPTTNQLSDVFASADQQAIASLLAKMAVDRSISASLDDARDAMMNACQDMMNAYASQTPASQRGGALLAPSTLRLIPLYTLSMLKSSAFRLSANIKLDDRVYAHLMAKTAPTSHLLQIFYPHMYPLHSLSDEDVFEHNNEKIPRSPRLQLSAANIDRHGTFLLDQGDAMFMIVGGALPDSFCKDVFDVPNFMSIPDGLTDLPELENPTSERVRCFIGHLMDSRPGGVAFLVLREDSQHRHRFFQHLVEDRSESSMSYYEFLQYLQQKVKG